MHDIVIRGGTIIDGTGQAAFTGDVAIMGGRIAAVGGKAGPSRREIDAAGLLVTPGWVDVHTHYDGQAMWDPLLAPSCWHGVTTTMFGNCGVGFAPVKPHHRAALMDLMEGVEEIPGVVLAEGLTWEWESFPDFLDALERRPHAIDLAAQVAHLPLRVYVMGDRAVRLETARPEDTAEMRRLTIEALRAGAFGFTTSRTNSHKTPAGCMVPSRNADADELLGIGSALGAVGTGTFGMNSDFDDEEGELAWMTKLAKETGRPVWFLLTDRYEDPARWRRLLAAVHAARKDGAPLTAQIAGRAIGVMMGIGTALNPFTVRPSYRKFENLGVAEQRGRLRDPEIRRQILADKPSERGSLSSSLCSFVATEGARHETSTPSIPSTGSGGRRISGRLGDCDRANVSDKAGAHRRRFCGWRWDRHSRSPDRSTPFGATRSTIHRREPAGRQQQHRNRSGRASAA
jgi:N-acyl-D-amino-acid deacylase